MSNSAIGGNHEMLYIIKNCLCIQSSQSVPLPLYTLHNLCRPRLRATPEKYAD